MPDSDGLRLWKDSPRVWCAYQSTELWKRVPEADKVGTTVAVAVALIDNERIPVVATNFRGEIPEDVFHALMPGERVAGVADPEGDEPEPEMDAEMRIIYWAEKHGYKLLAIGASRDICPECETEIKDRKIPIATPLVSSRPEYVRATRRLKAPPPKYIPPQSSQHKRGPTR